MSHYASCDAKFTDIECLVTALNEMGLTNVEVNEKAVVLVDYKGHTRPEKANVVVRRQHVGGAGNDIGFNTETGQAIISEYDSHNSTSARSPQAKQHGGYNVRWIAELKERYAVTVITKQINKLKAHGRIIRVISDETHGNNRVLTLKV